MVGIDEKNLQRFAAELKRDEQELARQERELKSQEAKRDMYMRDVEAKRKALLDAEKKLEEPERLIKTITTSIDIIKGRMQKREQEIDELSERIKQVTENDR